MEMTRDKRAPNWRKIVFANLVGGVVGAVGMVALIRLYESGALGDIGASEMVACTVGAVYALIGMQVVVGVALPALGLRILNVEDAEELLETRPMLAYAAIVMMAWGAALIVLGLAGPGGIIAPTAALVAALALFGASVVLTFFMWGHMDELMRGMSRECGNLSFYLMLLVGGVWAMLSHLGLAPAPAPLDWLTMFTAFSLLGAFIAVGQRGMILPR